MMCLEEGNLSVTCPKAPPELAAATWSRSSPPVLDSSSRADLQSGLAVRMGGACVLGSWSLNGVDTPALEKPVQHGALCSSSLRHLCMFLATFSRWTVECSPLKIRVLDPPCEGMGPLSPAVGYAPCNSHTQVNKQSIKWAKCYSMQPFFL